MKPSFAKRITTSLLVALLMFGSFVAGHITGATARPAHAQSESPAEFAIFWEAWDLVVEYFVDQERIDFKAMTYGAIQGMLDSLGDENHTVFFAPEVARQQESSLEGSFEGIGAYVSAEDGQFVIVAPIHGSPAEAAGIVAGDVVLAVDGKDITGMQEWEVIALIRGPAGSSVVLTVLHPDAEEPVDIEIQRGFIDIESVLWARIPGTDLVHLQITQFAGDTSRELRTALRAIQQEMEQGQPVEGILLDLRNNPGGYLQEALRVASQFLPEGEIILHEKDAKANITTYRSQGEGLARGIPLVVLINEGSASAAEIVAGALQENGRAKLVGAPTVGTGTVLRPFTLSDGSVLRLGVTNWLTPGYNLIKGQGIQPDVRIEQETTVEMINSSLLSELSNRDLRLHEDRQFQAALLLLTVNTLPNRQITTAPAQEN
ncbi:MAG TPA: S41 family peptidase [Caldilineaceae bacterium]|nr:S41 family peptidase [Caldilineaceae bacterium]